MNKLIVDIDGQRLSFEDGSPVYKFFHDGKFDARVDMADRSIDLSNNPEVSEALGGDRFIYDGESDRPTARPDQGVSFGVYLKRP